MTRYRPTDYVRLYEETLAKLETDSDDRALQHQAVLALARAGATDFAQAEYERYGLDQCHDDEDIMALAARLEKDRFLTASGDKKTKHANKSAGLYQAAFEKTGGFYSGINSATMSFISAQDAVRASIDADTILRLLPETEALSPENLYFIEATRAEGHLLRGDLKRAKASLQRAIRHDPLNYPAHSTTLKQF
ncbi:MAG: TRAFs-binding domain-containing protein, partial [Pseudomonadota bacterium]